MRYTTYYLTQNDCYKANYKMPGGKPKGIIVHSTGANNPYLRRYIGPDDGIIGKNSYGNHWNQGGLDVCVHFFIGLDKKNVLRCYNILPLDVCCWGVGRGTKGSYNYSPAYIQFEICEDNLKNKKYYTEAMKMAKELCADLCKKYDIPVKNVISHHEACLRGYGSNHADCDHWLKKFGDTMDDFRADVTKLIGKPITLVTENTTTKPVTTKVKVQNKTSHLRSDSRTDAKVLKTIKVGTELTWLSDDGWGWSKCKYGAITGWIQNTRISGKSGLSKYKTVTITGNGVRVRKTCSKVNTKNVIKTVTKGYTCKLICIRGDNWLNVSIDGKDCYIYYDKSYCKIS